MLTARQLKSGLLLLALVCAAWAVNDDHKFSDAELNYWAYQKVRKPPVPAARNRAWVKTPVDAFVLKELEAKQIKPSPSADKITLLQV